MKKFIERASAVGGHIPCGQRNFLDRALYEGRLTYGQLGMTDSGRTDTPPTAFGTWVHWFTQVQLRCDFKKADGDFLYDDFSVARAEAVKPTQELWTIATKMFAGDAAAQLAMAHAAGLMLARMPGKGSEWMAECAGNIPGLLTGHIDLLSADLEHLVDIKTTGQAPADGKMKPEHLWQLVAYALLVEHHCGRPPHFASILYVDRHGEWVVRTKPIDFSTDHGRGLMTELRRWLETTRDGVYSSIPNFGPHCDSAFCQYRGVCRDAVVPGAAVIVRRHDPVMTVSNPFQEPTHASNAS